MRFFVLLLLLVCSTRSIANDDDIDTVFIVFSNHLDVGYTDNNNGSSSGAVINRYFDTHFPNAQKLGNVSFSEGFQYKWMTHSWLVDVYLNCKDTIVNIYGPGSKSDLNCPTEEQLSAFESAVRSESITYHAFPFNAEPEMYNAELFEASLNITFALDDYFGLPRKRSLSQRDVPGLTRNAIPLLVRNGVRLISVGENSQCAPVNVPPIFVWRDDASNTEVIALFHGLGYGGSWPDRRRRVRRLQTTTCNYDNATCMSNPNLEFYRDSNGDLIATDRAMKYDDGPGIHVDERNRVVLNGPLNIELGEDKKNEACVAVKEARVALCYAWKVDNSGPHSKLGVDLIRDKIRILFPKAKQVASSSFDDFLDRVWNVKDTLPVVNREIGDTWIMGASSDPVKVAKFRSAQAAYSRCVKQNNCVDVQYLRKFVRLLTNAGEHTWGWNGGHIRRRAWSNSELENSRHTDEQFKTAELTWLEQRAFLLNALEVLPKNSTIAQEIREEWNVIENVTPFDLNNDFYVNVSPENPLTCGRLKLSLNIQDGSIERVVSEASSYNASLFRLHYQNLDHEAIESYAKDYVAGISKIDPDLIAENLVKPNMKLPSIDSNVTLVRVRTSNDSTKILLDLNFSNLEAHQSRGAPSHAQALLECDDDDDAISYTLKWFDKTPTHAPETIWMSHAEKNLDTTAKIFLSKLGTQIDSQDADLNCSGHRLTCGVHLHGVDRNGVSIRSKTQNFDLISLDSALVSVGSANPLPTPLRVPDVRGGIHFALVGNIWNTNYPFWYPFRDEDASSQFRFRVKFNVGH